MLRGILEPILSPLVTLKDVAHEAGLSVAAVSKALNGYPNVSEATRRRAMAASERLGYRRRSRSNGRSVARATTRRLGLVLVNLRADSFSVTPWVSAVTRIARQQGARVELGQITTALARQGAESEDEARGGELAQQARQVSGLLLFGYLQAPLARLSEELGVPTVVVGDVEPMHSPPRHQVSLDGQGMGALATRTLLEAGHRRVGFVGASEPRGGWSDQWLSGYQLTMWRHEADFTAETAAVFNVTSRYQLGIEAAAHYAALPDPPSAYIVPDLSAALSFRKEMAGRGFDLKPDQLVLGGDSTGALERGLGDYPLLSARPALGATHALQCLARLIDGEAVAPGRMLIPAEMHNFDVFKRRA